MSVFSTDMFTVIGGPMFSGKTTWLLNHARSLPDGSYRVYKPSLDTRYAENACVSHDGDSLSAVNIDEQLPKFSDLVASEQTILIDELNFFEPKALWIELEKQLALGRDVVGVGLLYDAMKQPFGATLPLSEKADTFIQLHATCDLCQGKAEHTYAKKVLNQTVVLGAAELYGACCEECWSSLQVSEQSDSSLGFTNAV